MKKHVSAILLFCVDSQFGCGYCSNGCNWHPLLYHLTAIVWLQGIIRIQTVSWRLKVQVLQSLSKFPFHTIAYTAKAWFLCPVENSKSCRRKLWRHMRFRCQWFYRSWSWTRRFAGECVTRSNHTVSKHRKSWIWSLDRIALGGHWKR